MRSRQKLAGLAAVATAVVVAMWSSAALAAPGVTVSPAIAAPTQTITVSGSGFAANEGVDVFLDTTDLALTGTDGNGTLFATPVALPAAVTPGTHWISLIGRRDGLYAQKLITVHTGWSQRSWSPFHRSLNPFENVLNPSNVNGLEEDWTAPTARVVFGGAVVGIGARQAFFGDDQGIVRAVSEVTGATVWTRALGGSVESTPAVDSGRVYVHANGDLYALDAISGAVVWQTPIGISAEGSVSNFSSPTVFQHRVYVGSDDGDLYVLLDYNGAIVWKGATGLDMWSSPAVSGGRVFVGSDDGNVYAFADNCATGGATCDPLWKRLTGNEVGSSPAVSNGVVYVGSDDGKLYALNAARGGILWTGTVPGGRADLNSPSVANGVVYMSSLSPGVLTAFPAACGTGGGSCTPLWQSPSYGGMDTTPAVANGVVYVGGTDANGANGLMMAFRAGTSCGTPCAPLWTATQPGTNYTPAVVSDGTLIAGSTAGLTAWDLGAASHAPAGRPDPRMLQPDLTLKPKH